MAMIWHLVAAAVIWTIATSAALARERTDIAMNGSKQSIDRLVERLATVKLTVDQIAHSLGSARVEGNGRATVLMNAPPFEGADIEDFRGVIKINFRFATGAWRVRDITDKPALWSVAPALPDMGRFDAVRDWDWKHVTVRCIVGVEDGGAIEDQLVRDVQCQITPR
jgi:hypothetical protein